MSRPAHSSKTKNCTASPGAEVHAKASAKPNGESSGNGGDNDDQSSGDESARFLRRKQASAYLIERYGFGAVRTLAKAAVEGGGPEFYKANRLVLYKREALDAWALAKIGAARRSTSDHGEAE